MAKLYANSSVLSVYSWLLKRLTQTSFEASAFRNLTPYSLNLFFANSFVSSATYKIIFIHNALAFVLTALTLGAAAHPGHDVEQEIAERSAYLRYAKRGLFHCAAKLKERGVEERALKRRAAMVGDLRTEAALRSKME